MTRSIEFVEAPGGVRTTWFLPLVAGIGAIVRVVPLLDQGGRVFRQYPTEDGYLMLTIARNLASGLGMSTAGGLHPTNGTQPLATFLWSFCFWLVGGDRHAGVFAVQLLQLAIASATAYLIFRLGTRLLGDDPEGRAQAGLGAVCWYASPIVVPHSMNCLETGLYGLCLTVCFLVLFAEGRRDLRARLLHWALVGAALGVAFWARNDAILLCNAVAIVHLVCGFGERSTPLRGRLVELSTAGLVVLVLALPWLLYNQLRFGSLMPVSGQSEAFGAAFGENLPAVAPNLLEYLLLVVPIPGTLIARGWVMALSSVLAVALFVMLSRHAVGWRARPRLAYRLGAVLMLLLVSFYGLFFGAGYFLSRYLFALSPLLALLWGSAAYAAFARLRQHNVPMAATVSTALVGMALVCHARAYVQGSHHPHFQVVEWVAQNVPETTWVGAIQTGTLGFFHDRTINLDGKVNAEALHARKADRVPEYVVQSEITYLVDWSEILRWNALPPIAQHFSTLVDRPEDNLAVLRRKPMLSRASELPLADAP